MSAKVERMSRKLRGSGGVLDDIPSDTQVKSGFIAIDGVQYVELVDGRIARVPKPKRLIWTGTRFEERQPG